MSVVEKFRTMDYGPAPEDPKESLQWLDRFKRRFGHFIAGVWKAPVDGKYFETADPSTGERIAEVAQGCAADVDAAIKAARAALKGWQCSKPSTTGSRFARAGTSTFL
jgi:aldehyde dehydrogenase (NAD+)